MTKPRAAKYRRISDDREGNELGVTRQSDDLDAFAAARGYLIVDDYPDNDIGASTRSRKTRPQYQRMLADAKAGLLDVVIAYTSSRLTRRPREFEDIIELAQQHAVRFEFIRSPSFDLNTADGRQVARILAGADAAEAERIGERVARQALQRAERGSPPRGHALGYTRDGLALAEPAATHVRDGYLAALAGASLSSVARRWNTAGLLTCHGNTWDAKPVRDVLRNPRYAALVYMHGAELLGVTATWPAIVDEDVWRGVQAILADPVRRTQSGTARRWLLSGIARCGMPGCGAPMTSGTNQYAARTLKCTRARHLERVAAPIEEYVVEVALARLRRLDAADLLVPPAPDLGPLRARAAGLRIQRSKLAADVTLEHDFAAARDKALAAELARVQVQLDAGTRSSALAGFAGRDPGERWAELADDLAARRSIIAELMTVTVLPAGRGARTFRAESVELDPVVPSGSPPDQVGLPYPGRVASHARREGRVGRSRVR